MVRVFFIYSNGSNPWFFQVVIHVSSKVVRYSDFSDLMDPRMCLIITDLRNCCSAKLFVGGMRGSSTNLNRFGRARLSFGMNLPIMGSSEYFRINRRTRARRFFRYLMRMRFDFLQMSFTSWNILRNTTNTLSASSLSGFLSDSVSDSRIMWAQHRCISYWPYAGHLSHIRISSQSGSRTSSGTSEPLLLLII